MTGRKRWQSARSLRSREKRAQSTPQPQSHLQSVRRPPATVPDLSTTISTAKPLDLQSAMEG